MVDGATFSKPRTDRVPPLSRGAVGVPARKGCEVAFALLAGVLLVGCTRARDDRPLASTYQNDVKALLDAKCASCHQGEEAPAGWRADSYLGAIGCTTSGEIALRGPIARALARADHATLLTASERATFDAWIAGGAPSVRAGTHAASFADPRSPASHGRFLRERRWRPMLDARDPDACGACHDGSPAPASATFAPGATACTTCHDEAGGPLACSTCHGAPGRAYPPRDACFFPDDTKDTQHPAHAGKSAASVGVACSVCHPQPRLGEFTATHGDGRIEVWLQRDARFDASTKLCTGTCHARGGARPDVAWTERGPVTCNDCHATPPRGHYVGACTACHHEANADGSGFVNPVLHMRGDVVLGDGSSGCGACHGAGDDPWPASGAHLAHRSPKSAQPVPCETCHDLPRGKHPVGGGVVVRLFGLATAGAHRPTWDPITKTCSGTYCHEGRGGTANEPAWTDGPSASACGGCHGLPPSAPHSIGASCNLTTCHEGSVTIGPTGPVLTPNGAKVHVNGVVDRSVP